MRQTEREKERKRAKSAAASAHVCREEGGNRTTDEGEREAAAYAYSNRMDGCVHLSVLLTDGVDRRTNGRSTNCAAAGAVIV